MPRNGKRLRNFWNGANGFIDKIDGVIKNADKLTTFDVNTNNEFSLSNEAMTQLAIFAAVIYFVFKSD